MALINGGRGSSASLKSVDRTNFVATAGQTVFTLSQGYSVGDVDVFLNGVKLADSDDYAAINGSTVVLTVGATVGDYLQVVSYNQFSAANAYTKSEADSRYMVATGTTPMTSYLRTPNYGVSSYSDTASASLEANPGLGESGVGIKAFGRSIPTNGGNIHHITDTRGAGGSHKFYGWNGTVLTNFMTIDSSGRMLRPQTPAFQTNNIGYGGFTAQKKPITATAAYNQGGWYDASTGRFTAQVAGLYHFHGVCTPSSAASGPAFYISKNGTYDQQGISLAYATSYNACSVTVNTYLNVGDYVQCIIEEWNSTTVSIWNCSWGGHLIG